MTQNTNPPIPEDPAHSFTNHPGAPGPQPAGPSLPGSSASGAQQQTGDGKGGDRPSNLVLAGAGSLLAVLAFLGGAAVGHAWDGFNTQQNQFGGPGGGRQFPGQQGQQGQLPGQDGQGQGTTGQGQGTMGQGQGTTGQGTMPDQGNQSGTGTGQTQTS
jgi:hypothetical protein